MILLKKHGHGLFATDEESESALERVPEGAVLAVETPFNIVSTLQDVDDDQ